MHHLWYPEAAPCSGCAAHSPGLRSPWSVYEKTSLAVVLIPDQHEEMIPNPQILPRPSAASAITSGGASNTETLMHPCAACKAKQGTDKSPIFLPPMPCKRAI